MLVRMKTASPIRTAVISLGAGKEGSVTTFD